ncbi:hypothetical protein ACQKWADRAFT_278784, partial [Trichoderma austrokoningii]
CVLLFNLESWFFFFPFFPFAAFQFGAGECRGFSRGYYTQVFFFSLFFFLSYI